MKYLIILSVFISAVFLTGCRTAVENQTFTVNSKSGSKAYISFNDDGTFNGFSGVNRFFGNFKTEGGKIILSGVGMTRMAGDPEDMKFEDKFIDTLNHADIFVEGDQLIFSRNNKTVMHLDIVKTLK